MNISINRFVQWIALATIAALISACQPSTPVSSTMKFVPPDRIVQVRAVDLSAVSPYVRLSNGTDIPMLQNSDGSWTGTILVQPNNTYSVTVEWIEAMQQGNLVLARWEDDVVVGDEGAAISLNNDNYDFNIDTDGDSISNLQERQDDTDPFTNNDTGVSNAGNNDTNGTNNSDSSNTDGSDSDSSTDGQTGNSDAADDNDDDNDATESDDDDDDSTTPSDGNGTDNNSSSGSGATSNATVLIPRITDNQAPAIDGAGVTLNNQDNLTGEWASAVQFDNAGERLWVDNLMIDAGTTGTDGDDGDKHRRWAAMHDGEYLYVLVLSDDIGRRNADSEEPWQDDAVELFIDGNNSKLSSWGDNDDFHVLIPLLKLNTTQANNELNGRSALGPGSTDIALGIEFSTGPGIGPDGIRIARWEQDVYEIAIPIDNAGITIGSDFGFEIQIDDDDNGDTRDSKWGWFHPSRQNNTNTDLTFQNPSIMGTVVLEN